MGKEPGKILIISVITLALLITGFLLFYPVPSPPSDILKTARDSISIALKKQADRYAPELFIQAKNSYDSAIAVWKRENERFIYARNYDPAKDYARMALKFSNLASVNSVELRSELMVKARENIDSLNNLLKRINDRYISYPYPVEIRERISKGKMLLKDAEVYLAEELYREADSLTSESEKLLSSAREFADLNLTEYFKSWPLWKKWITNTIAVSKKTGAYAIIADKFSRKLLLYHRGEKIKEYSAELGSNWVGNKRTDGDKATPEGMYKIIKKLDGNNTKYHKALLLNYPNTEDAARFKREVAGGSLPASAKIGGMIEIHGAGGKGADWTDGCIALTNSEIDVIYRLVNIGTPVTIVGSIYNIDQVLN
ncbi:MAG TPA: hypothetical protein DDW27_07095 [Bacteroidales bacterium]|nr:hypothetical protein [Bacteroidales bacterium]